MWRFGILIEPAGRAPQEGGEPVAFNGGRQAASWARRSAACRGARSRCRGSASTPITTSARSTGWMAGVYLHLGVRRDDPARVPQRRNGPTLASQPNPT
jgi:hypothetical protein